MIRMQKQMQGRAARYGDLEAELGKRVGAASHTSYQELKLTVITCDMTAEIRGINRHTLLNEALGLQKKPAEELRRLCNDVLSPMRERLEGIKPLLKLARCVDDPKMKRGLGKSIGKRMRPLLKMVRGCPNVKKILVYPLLIPVLNNWGSLSPLAAAEAVRWLRKNEANSDLKVIIDQLDAPVTTEQVMENFLRSGSG